MVTPTTIRRHPARTPTIKRRSDAIRRGYQRSHYRFAYVRCSRERRILPSPSRHNKDSQLLRSSADAPYGRETLSESPAMHPVDGQFIGARSSAIMVRRTLFLDPVKGVGCLVAAFAQWYLALRFFPFIASCSPPLFVCPMTPL